jgi:hypothetical protein
MTRTGDEAPAQRAPDRRMETKPTVAATRSVGREETQARPTAPPGTTIGALAPARTLLRMIAGGVAGGMGATLAETLVLALRNPTSDARTIAACAAAGAAVFCGVGIALALLLQATLVLALVLRFGGAEGAAVLSGRDRRIQAVWVSCGLFYLVGLMVCQGKLLDWTAPLPVSPRRTVWLALGGGLLAVVWTSAVRSALPVLQSLARRPRSLFRPLLFASSLILVLTTAALVHNPANQFVALALLLEGFVLPAAVIGLRPQWFRDLYTNALAAFGVAAIVATVLHGASPQTLYRIWLGRSISTTLLRELPVLSPPAATAALTARLEASFPVDAALGPARPLPYQAPLALPTGVRPDIILVTVDALRADRVFGPLAVTVMPRLSGFAAQATSFTRAFAVAPTTVGAVTQIMTGTPEHLVPHLPVGPGGQAALYPDVPTLAKRLGSAGYRTRAALGAQALSYFPSFGLGFDRAEGDSRQPSLAVKRLVDDLIAETTKDDGRPLFAWAHVMEVHNHPLNGRGMTQAYDAIVHGVDRELGRLLDALAQSPRWSRTVVILTSDHGESLGEGGMQTHARSHPRTIAVPLVIRFPNQAPSAVAATVGHLDLAPTIMTAAGLDSSSLAGRDLRAVATAPSPPERPAFFENVIYSAMTSALEIGVVTYPWMLTYNISQRFPVLIDLEHDPDGLRNLVGAGRPEEDLLIGLLVDTLAQ